MLQFFRKSIHSKLGAVFALVVLVLIALAFASGDVANNGGFGGVAGGDRVATVGKDRISTSDLSQAASSALEKAKGDNPRLSMRAFLVSGGLEQVLDQMIDRTAIAVFGKKHGIIASDRLIDSEITKISAFRGPDGSFSEEAFHQAMKQRGISEKLVREDLEQGLIARQVVLPASFGAVVPREVAKRYATLLTEKRRGAIALLPSPLFAPGKAPGDAELADYYKAHKDNFIRPERRVIRFASFGEDALKSIPAPTEAEIAARYNADKTQYAALETRSMTQLIVPTEAAAKAVVAEVSGGKTLEAAAKGKGLATARLEKLGKQALSLQTSPAVANAAYATGKGALAAPAKSPLGWHVLRIDGIETRPGRALEQVRGEIVEQLAAQKKRAALTDLVARIEEEFDEGGNLADAAKQLGLAPQQTAQLTADGAVYGKPGEKAPDILARVLQTAFSMEGENEPQIAEVEPGKTFLIFDVTDIATSAPAPLAEIREDVITAYMLDKGAASAKGAAAKVQAEVRKGSTLAAAVASLKKPLPPPQAVDMNREQLMRIQQATRQVPPPLALLFNMAEGSVKLLPAPRNQGWFVVLLQDIEPGKVIDGDPLPGIVQRDLASITGQEYTDALRQAIRAEVGVQRNSAAIKVVRTQLGGEN